jgi:hypothetical protein
VCPACMASLFSTLGFFSSLKANGFRGLAQRAYHE